MVMRLFYIYKMSSKNMIRYL